MEGDRGPTSKGKEADRKDRKIACKANKAVSVKITAFSFRMQEKKSRAKQLCFSTVLLVSGRKKTQVGLETSEMYCMATSQITYKVKVTLK